MKLISDVYPSTIEFWILPTQMQWHGFEYYPSAYQIYPSYKLEPSNMLWPCLLYYSIYENTTFYILSGPQFSHPVRSPIPIPVSALLFSRLLSHWSSSDWLFAWCVTVFLSIAAITAVSRNSSVKSWNIPLLPSLRSFLVVGWEKYPFIYMSLIAVALYIQIRP